MNINVNLTDPQNAIHQLADTLQRDGLDPNTARQTAAQIINQRLTMWRGHTFTFLGGSSDQNTGTGGPDFSSGQW